LISPKAEAIPNATQEQIFLQILIEVFAITFKRMSANVKRRPEEQMPTSYHSRFTTHFLNQLNLEK
jgi:hypothetical protein